MEPLDRDGPEVTVEELRFGPMFKMGRTCGKCW
jgi:hypothetical protein